MQLYVIAGPVAIGNLFGHYGHMLAEGEFAVVEDGEYSNGGYGPSQSIQRVFRTRDEAEESLAKLISEKK